MKIDSQIESVTIQWDDELSGRKGQIEVQRAVEGVTLWGKCDLNDPQCMASSLDLPIEALPQLIEAFKALKMLP